MLLHAFFFIFIYKKRGKRKRKEQIEKSFLGFLSVTSLGVLACQVLIHQTLAVDVIKPSLKAFAVGHVAGVPAERILVAVELQMLSANVVVNAVNTAL